MGKLGSVHNELGKNDEALEYLNQALKLARDRGDRADEAGVLQTIGRVYRSIGEAHEIDRVSRSITGSVERYSMLTPPWPGPTIISARLINDLGEYEKAISYLNEGPAGLEIQE